MFRHAEIKERGSIVTGLPSLTGGPFEVGVEASVTSPFGPREAFWTPSGWTSDFHYGIDLWSLPAPLLLALSDGKVSAGGDWHPKLGNWIRVTLGEWSWEYYHMEAPTEARIGDVVRAGDEVGRVGTTGLSTAPHLHMAVLRSGAYVDPLPVLKDGTPALPAFASPPVWDDRGQAMVVFNGGSMEDLAAAVEAVGARGAWVQDSAGVYRLFTPTPLWLREQFEEVFPGGLYSRVAVTLVK